MKLNIKLFLAIFLILLFTFGCQKKAEISDIDSRIYMESVNLEEQNEGNSVEKTEEKTALIIESHADYNALALTFEELYADADIIFEFEVKDVDSFIEEETGRIISDITPEVIQLYKGEHTGKHLQLVGGSMDYTEYMSNEIIKEKFEGREEPNQNAKALKNKDVLFIMDDGYIYEKGERYFFFGKEYEDEDFIRPIYAYQSSFKIENETVLNKALKNDEPLFEDIKNRFFVNSKSNILNVEESKMSVNKVVFEEELNKINE